MLSNIFCFAGYKSYAISKNYFASVSDMGEANHEKVSKNVRLIIRNVEFLEVAFSICFLFGILLQLSKLSNKIKQNIMIKVVYVL